MTAMRGCARQPDGSLRLAHPRLAQAYRLNVGVIVEDPMVEMRLQSRGRPAGAGGRRLGQLEEYFIEQLSVGDTFVFRRRCAALRGPARRRRLCHPHQRSGSGNPQLQWRQISAFHLPGPAGARNGSSAGTLAHICPSRCRNGCKIQEWRSVIPKPGQLLVETFPRGNRHYLVCYPFEGRLAHQTLGMLLTRRLERAHVKPLGFVANEYALAVWAARDMASVDMDAPVRRGHAGRRSGCLAGRIQSLQAHLPQLRHHRRADRAQVARQGKNRAAGDLFLRPDLRRAARA